jgi:hypothetical protein
MIKQLIVGLNGCRNLRLHGSQVIKLIDHGNVQIYNARLAMTTVGTLSAVGVEWCIGNDRCIVFLILACSLVGDGFVELFFCIIAAKDRRYSRAA